jgi:hypothetical protein
MKTHTTTTMQITDINNELAADVEAAYGATFSPEDNKLREVQSFFELRALHNRGHIGDSALRTAHRNAVKATEFKHMDYEGKWTTFDAGMSVTHVTDDGVSCLGRITATHGDMLHIQFRDGDEGWEKTTSCFLD